MPKILWDVKIVILGRDDRATAGQFTVNCPEESPSSTGKVPVNDGAGRPDGKCHRKQPLVNSKGEKVR